MKHFLQSAQQSLEEKLNLLAEGMAMELTPEEAAIYGADQSDTLPEGEEANDVR